MTPPELTGKDLRSAFSRFPTGVVAVCAYGSAGPVGLVVSTFVPVSLDPPLLAICLQRTSRTWPVLRTRPRLGVSVLGEHQSETARALAARDGDRFAGVQHSRVEGGGLRVVDSSAYFDCSLDQEVAAGDHDLALLRIHRAEVSDSAQPLVFHRSQFARLTAPVI